MVFDPDKFLGKSESSGFDPDSFLNKGKEVPLLSPSEASFEPKKKPTGRDISSTYSSQILSASKKYNVPAHVITAVIKHESAGNPSAVSPKGAYGLMQLMPDTARSLGVDPKDPTQNIDGGTRYLKQQYDKFGSWELAFAAYNAGPGNVQKYGGIPPFKETKNYVSSILKTLGTPLGGSMGDVKAMGSGMIKGFGEGTAKGMAGMAALTTNIFNAVKDQVGENDVLDWLTAKGEESKLFWQDQATRSGKRAEVLMRPDPGQGAIETFKRRLLQGGSQGAAYMTQLLTLQRFTGMGPITGMGATSALEEYGTSENFKSAGIAGGIGAGMGLAFGVTGALPLNPFAKAGISGAVGGGVTLATGGTIDDSITNAALGAIWGLKPNGKVGGKKLEEIALTELQAPPPPPPGGGGPFAGPGMYPGSAKQAIVRPTPTTEQVSAGRRAVIFAPESASLSDISNNLNLRGKTILRKQGPAYVGGTLYPNGVTIVREQPPKLNPRTGDWEYPESYMRHGDVGFVVSNEGVIRLPAKFPIEEQKLLGGPTGNILTPTAQEVPKMGIKAAPPQRDLVFEKLNKADQVEHLYQKHILPVMGTKNQVKGEEAFKAEYLKHITKETLEFDPQIKNLTFSQKEKWGSIQGKIGTTAGSLWEQVMNERMAGVNLEHKLIRSTGFTDIIKYVKKHKLENIWTYWLQHTETTPQGVKWNESPLTIRENGRTKVDIPAYNQTVPKPTQEQTQMLFKTRAALDYFQSQGQAAYLPRYISHIMKSLGAFQAPKGSEQGVASPYFNYERKSGKWDSNFEADFTVWGKRYVQALAKENTLGRLVPDIMKVGHQLELMGQKGLSAQWEKITQLALGLRNPEEVRLLSRETLLNSNPQVYQQILKLASNGNLPLADQIGWMAREFVYTARLGSNLRQILLQALNVPTTAAGELLHPLKGLRASIPAGVDRLKSRLSKHPGEAAKAAAKFLKIPESEARILLAQAKDKLYNHYGMQYESESLTPSGAGVNPWLRIPTKILTAPGKPLLKLQQSFEPYNRELSFLWAYKEFMDAPNKTTYLSKVPLTSGQRHLVTKQVETGNMTAAGLEYGIIKSNRINYTYDWVNKPQILQNKILRQAPFTTWPTESFMRYVAHGAEESGGQVTKHIARRLAYSTLTLGIAEMLTGISLIDQHPLVSAASVTNISPYPIVSDSVERFQKNKSIKASAEGVLDWIPAYRVPKIAYEASKGNEKYVRQKTGLRKSRIFK